MKKNRTLSRRRQVSRHLPGRRDPGGKKHAYPVRATYSSLAQSLASFISKVARYPLRAKCPRWPGWRQADRHGKKLSILTIVPVVIAVVLMGLIVIQRGKGADAGAAFGSERKMPGVNKVSYATNDGYVPKTEYEKLRREVETLKSQMQRLLEALPAAPASKPAAAKAAAPASKPAAAKAAAPASKPAAAEAATPASKPAAAEVKGEKKPVPSAPPPSQESVGRADQEEFAAEKGDRRKEAEEAKRELDQFLRARKLLFKPGEIQLEFGASYGQDAETNRVNPLGPVFVVRSASANFLMRYGLAEDLEFDLGVPLVYTQLERDIRPFSQIQVGTILFPSFTREAGVGLGDISGGLRYAAIHEEGAIPEVTLSVIAKSDTGDADRLLGTGHWNVGTGVSLVKTIDPVVFFGSLGYTWTLEEEDVDLGMSISGDVDPGDQIPYSIGMGFSLNDRVSFSMAMGGAAIRRTEVNGREISGSGLDVNSLQFSTTVQLAKRVFVEPVVGFGLTDDASDFLVGINIPFGLEGRFPLPFFHNL